jgi:hypothetical protein
MRPGFVTLNHLHHVPQNVADSSRKSSKWSLWRLIMKVLLPQIVFLLVYQSLQVNATFVRKKLRQKIRQNQPQLLESGALILHDNARPHIAQSVKDIMADYKWEVLPHPAYSPDMSPPDYDLFPKLKKANVSQH